MKRTNAFVLVLVLVLSLVLTACGQSTQVPTGPADYSVKVTDAKGVPYTSGVIVKFMKDGAQVAMQPIDASGVATMNLERGSYTVELVFTAPLEWQLKDQGLDIINTAVSITESGLVIWADDFSTAPEYREQGSYVIATSMKWRFL